MQKLHKQYNDPPYDLAIRKGRSLKLGDYYEHRYQEVVHRLRSARLESGLSQEEVARRLGTSQSFVSRAETGERRIDVIELQAFADVYGKPIEYFLVGGN